MLRTGRSARQLSKRALILYRRRQNQARTSTNGAVTTLKIRFPMMGMKIVSPSGGSSPEPVSYTHLTLPTSDLV